MEYYEEVLDEDKEYEKCMIEVPPMIMRESFVKIPTSILRNPEYQKWRATARASVAEFLFGFVVRSRCGNLIADHLYKKYYREQGLLVARFTHQGLAERMGYRDRRGINNHMVVLEKEGIFKSRMEPWRNRKIKIYEFGTWANLQGCNYIENVYMYSKFHKLHAENNIGKLS